jgi:hypothetical protein
MKMKHILLATAAAAILGTVTSSGPASADHWRRRVIVREVVPLIETRNPITFVTPDTVWIPGSSAFVTPSDYRVVWVRVNHQWVRRIVWP